LKRQDARGLMEKRSAVEIKEGRKEEIPIVGFSIYIYNA
jgi:hypothetical protein